MKSFTVSTPEACQHGHVIADWRGGRVSEFFEIVFGLPTVIFTAALAISLGFFLITFLFGLGEGGGGDFDLDAGGGDLDVEIDAGGSDGADGADGDSTGALAGLLQAANLHVLPLALTFAIVSLVGWFISAMGTFLLTSDNSPNVIVALAIALAGFAGGVFIAGRVGNLLRPIFVPAKHIKRSDLIGRICTVQTGSVDRSFGQAEVVDGEHSTHLIQVRCEIDNDLGSGKRALIVDVDDDGRFIVSPDVKGLV